MEQFFYFFVFFVFGAIIGSFLNVVILRHGSGISIEGRSKCFSCSKTLSWLELIPIASYIFQRGRCLNCHSKISIQYPLVEFLTGLTFLFLFIKISNLFELVFALIITSTLIVISIYDIRHKIIPNEFVYFLAFISLTYLFIDQSFFDLTIPQLESVLAGPILFLPFALIWFLSNGAWMGLGDAKLALALGFWLGFSSGMSAIILAFWIGAAFSLIFILLQKIIFLKKKGRGNINMKSEIPFGPFLALGGFLAFLFEVDLLTLANWLTF